METTAYVRVVASLALVVGLMMAVLWVLRRFNIGGMVARPGARRRLAVAEILTLDSRRRLLLVRRDGVEHLLLVGGAQDVVVESGIVAAGDMSGPTPGGGPAPAAEGEERAE